MASVKTNVSYMARGMVYLKQARQRFPDSTPLESLCLHAEARAGVLKPSTVGVYRRQYAMTASAVARDIGLDIEDLAKVLQRIFAALERLRGKPDKPRTSSKKIKDPTDWMVKAVFGHLKIAALRHHRIRLAATALYCLVLPTLGTRPVELLGARVDGDILFVPNAKRRGEHKTYRSIDISDFHPTHRTALIALIHIADSEVRAGGYDAWLSLLAENLARACESVSRKTGQKIPRLCLSAFRHTAISTWHAAGYTAEEIAELVGHLSLRSQKAYKRSSSAWPLAAPLAKPAKNAPATTVRRVEKVPKPIVSKPTHPVTENPEDYKPPGP